MQTVTFAREYRHKIDDLRTAIYPPNVEIEVPNLIADAARIAGALKDDENGRGLVESGGTRLHRGPKGKRAPTRNSAKGSD